MFQSFFPGLLHRGYWHLLLCLSLTLTCSFPAFASEFAFTNAPPEGFEDLTSQQTNQVDIYFSGKLVASAMATFDLTSIEFLESELISNAIPDLIDPKIVTDALSGALDPHTENLCVKIQTQNCGSLAPEIAEIIFDADRFRVDLFINPLYLEVRSLQSTKFLPAPEKKLTSVNGFSALISGGNSVEQRSRFTANSIASYGRTRLINQISLQSDQGLILDTTRLEHDESKWTYSLGTMDSIGTLSSMVTTRPFLGLRAARTLKSRTDLRLSNSNSIYFFINERSRVEVLKDGKLMSSRFYEAGNQQLDTINLPGGAYEIVVRITNSQGEKLRTEFFTRSSLLPPKKHALHFLETGSFIQLNDQENLRTLPETNGESFVHGGSRFRVKDNLGGEFDFLSIPNQANITQAGLFYFMPGIFMRGGLLIGSQHAQGIFTSINYRHKRLSVHYDFYDLSLHQEGEADPQSPFRQGSKSTLSLGASLFGGSLTSRMSKIDTGTEEERTEYSLNYRRSLMRRGDSNLDFTFSWASSNNDESVLFGWQYAFGKVDKRRTINTRWSKIANETASGVELDGRYSRIHRSNNDQSIRHTVFTRVNQKQQNLGLRIEQKSRLGKGIFETQHHRISKSDQDTYYSASYQSSILTGNSSMSLGGSKAGKAAIVINLKGVESDEFEILVNNRSTFMQGSNQEVILVQPYQQYQIDVIQRGEKLVDLDSKVKKVTLYPGNVAHLDWKIEPIFIVVGQAVNPDKTALSNARIKNLKEFSSTDALGWFQIELSEMKTLELVSANQPDCKIALPKKISNEEIVVLDQLVCEPEPGLK